jgi:hypothetical protein
LCQELPQAESKIVHRLRNSAEEEKGDAIGEVTNITCKKWVQEYDKTGFGKLSSIKLPVRNKMAAD